MSPAILRRKSVLKITALSNTTMYRKIAAGTFPAPLRLGPRAVGWLESAVCEWVESLPQVGTDADVDRETPAPNTPRKLGRTRRPRLDGKGGTS